MQLYYYQRRDRQSNFGDELNTWLWPRLLPNFFDDNATTRFVGTGTLLNQRLPERTHQANRVVIFSSGAGYESPLRQVPDHWQIYCVRGPRSAQQLGLPDKMAIADGGLLVNQCFQPVDAHACKGASFIPHIHHANYAQPEWELLCQGANIRYIDPRWPVEQVLQAIGESSVLLAEAMHGAIVADALRVPWVPIVTSPRILRFKWLDWCDSMGLPYRPQYLAPLADYPRYGRGLRSGLRTALHWGHLSLVDWGNQPFEAQLRRLEQVKAVEPCLSEGAIAQCRVAALLDRLETMGKAERAS
ncbi:MAG: polysaccharide pyruvyl transferase family protein [Cyanobacteria bacterium J06626_23]